MTVHHVFPYDPGHFGLTLEQWWRGQLLRWPLAAVVRSRSAADTVVHVIADRTAQLPDAAAPLTLQVHRTLYRNARWHAWGDDWSVGLGRALRQAGHDDVVVVHLEGYAAARLCLRYARGARCVLALHGRGTGSMEEHDAADVSVVLNDDARATLRERGVPATAPGDDPQHRPRNVPLPSGSAGRRARARLRRKAGGEQGRVRAARHRAQPGRPRRQPGVRGEHASTGRRGNGVAAEFAGIPVRFCGELPPIDVAARMRGWGALVLPSYTEGMPLVALEALSSGIPVVAVAGVLPHILANHDGVWVGSRDTLADRTRAALAAGQTPRPAWIPDHEQGGRTLGRGLRRPAFVATPVQAVRAAAARSVTPPPPVVERLSLRGRDRVDRLARVTSVLWYSNETPDVHGQGGQRRQYFQIRSLVDAGHDVTVVSLAGEQDDASIRSLTEVRRLPGPAAGRRVPPRLRPRRARGLLRRASTATAWWSPTSSRGCTCGGAGSAWAGRGCSTCTTCSAPGTTARDQRRTSPLAPLESGRRARLSTRSPSARSASERRSLQQHRPRQPSWSPTASSPPSGRRAPSLGRAGDEALRELGLGPEPRRADLVPRPGGASGRRRHGDRRRGRRARVPRA